MVRRKLIVIMPDGEIRGYISMKAASEDLKISKERIKLALTFFWKVSGHQIYDAKILDLPVPHNFRGRMTKDD